MARTCALTTYTTTASRYSFGDQTDRFLHRRTAALFYALHGSDHEVGAVRALTKPTTAKIALIYKKSEAIFASCRWICRALRDRQIQSPLATNFAAGKISSSAALASCGHLRPCKLPWMQVCFLGLRAFSTLCQSVDFVNILSRSFRSGFRFSASPRSPARAIGRSPHRLPPSLRRARPDPARR